MHITKRLVESRSPDDELAAAFVENGKREEKKRIVPYVLKFDINGEPSFKYKKDTVLGMAEYTGMKNMRELALTGYNFVVWASPEGGRSDYNDGNRLVVAVVTRRGGEVQMECRGIVLKNETPEELLGCIRRLEENGAAPMDEIRCPEDLREQAVGLKVNNESELWQEMERAFGHSEIWDEIRRDQDMVNKKLAQEMIARFRNSPESEIAKKRGDIWWGGQLEMFMARNGYEIQGGNHGVTNLSLLATMSSFNRLFNLLPVVSSENLDHRLKRCETCGCYFMKKKGACPKCSGRN